MCTWSSYHWYYRYQLICILEGVIGLFLKVCFIATHFSHLPPKVLDKVTLQCHARPYVLLLVDGSLFADKKETYLQLIILPMLIDFFEIAQYS